MEKMIPSIQQLVSLGRNNCPALKKPGSGLHGSNASKQRGNKKWRMINGDHIPHGETYVWGQRVDIDGWLNRQSESVRGERCERLDARQAVASACWGSTAWPDPFAGAGPPEWVHRPSQFTSPLPLCLKRSVKGGLLGQGGRG